MRFGDASIDEINSNIDQSVPENTKRTNSSIWKQFSYFCKCRNYQLTETSAEEDIAEILKDWAFNMRKQNGEDYKESAVKTLWNVTAKRIQEMYHDQYKRDLNPFSSIVFKSARDARDSKRKSLQADEKKRKRSSNALEENEMITMLSKCDEENPHGLQKKFFLLASVELAWRGNEGAKCLINYFKEEFKNDAATGRIEYNPIFNKTSQGGNKKLADSKWLISNENKDICPVRLFKKLVAKRNDRIKTDRLFLTPNPAWRMNPHGWFKNMPVGVNEISKWMKSIAEEAGVDTSIKRITNHSSRATAVSRLAKAGVGEQQLIKITGHSNANSIKPYLQMDEDHHADILKKMRNSAGSSCSTANQVSTTTEHHFEQGTVFNNCTFNCTSIHFK